ncbi:MAG: elongation factor P [Capsulimonadales bacterium]|nr:elongation factor P [Capsulimonadales bacterium]
MDTSDFRNGLSILLDNDIWTIVEFMHVKPGKGAAFVRTRIKNLRTGNSIERTFRAGEKVEQAVLERTTMQYLYTQDDEAFLMDMESFEQTGIQASLFGDQRKYLKENMDISVIRYKGEVIGVSVPDFMELQVVETDPGVRGDTATGGSKPAKVETGAVVNVPLFINIGEKIRIDTRTDSYLERVK